MKQFTGYMHGINLGCWLCQCNETVEHYETRIGPEDFHRIAEWGLDHVRIPFGYRMVTDYNYLYLDRALTWAKEAGLNVLLDMHAAPHYNFDLPHSPQSTMFERPDEQRAFADLWADIARHYQAEGANLAFELLNEVTDEDAQIWNQIIRMTVESIRSVSPQRDIVIGGTNWSKIDGLSRLETYQDEHIIYTWHTYEPYALTHQRASWWKEQLEFKRQVAYPDDMTDYDAYFDFMGHRTPWATSPDRMDKDYLERYVAEAVQFAEERNVIIYCGEFGCIDLADSASRRHWHRDILSLFARYGIGYALWNYCDNRDSGGFAVTYMNGELKDPLLIAMLGPKTEQEIQSLC